MRSIESEFYKSGAWQRCRRAYIKKVGGVCERCRALGLLTPGKIVHHRIPLTPERMADDSLLYGFDNLELLCADCHNKEHKSDRRYAFDAEGNIIYRE